MSPDPFLMGGVWVRDYSRSPFLLIFRSYTERAWENEETQTRNAYLTFMALESEQGLGWWNTPDVIYRTKFIKVHLDGKFRCVFRQIWHKNGLRWVHMDESEHLLVLWEGHCSCLLQEYIKVCGRKKINANNMTKYYLLQHSSHLVGNWVDQCYPPSWQLNSEITFFNLCQC